MCLPGLHLTGVGCVTLDHMFTLPGPWVCPLLNEEPLADLRANNALILCVPSKHEAPGGLRTHRITWGSSLHIC